MTPRAVLVTGGGGFLGAHVTRRLHDAGVAVRVLDVEMRIPAGGPTVEVVQGDVRDARALAGAIEGVDVVIHAAAASPRQTPDVIEQVNVEGTRNVCEQARRRHVRRLVLVSSTIVTRPGRVHPLLAGSPLTRLDLYRRSRVAAEAIVTEYGGRGLSTAIARPKTLVGPGRVGAFAIVFEWIRTGRPVIVLGSGRNRYQLLDTRDMADGLARLAASDAGGVFSFGAGDVRTVREDLATLLEHARTGARLRHVPARLARVMLRAMEYASLVPASEWHAMTAAGLDSMVDVSRAAAELGWQPVRSNARALIDAYDWYVTTVRATGSAPTTHPVPLLHRALKRAARLVPW